MVYILYVFIYRGLKYKILFLLVFVDNYKEREVICIYFYLLGIIFLIIFLDYELIKVYSLIVRVIDVLLGLYGEIKF